MTSTIMSPPPAAQPHHDQESSQFIDAHSLIDDEDEKHAETEKLDLTGAAHTLSDTDDTHNSEHENIGEEEEEQDQQQELGDKKDADSDNLAIPHSSSFAKGIKDQLRSDLSMTKSKSMNSFNSAQSQSSPKLIVNSPSSTRINEKAQNTTTNNKFLSRSLSVSSSSKSSPSTSTPLVSKTNAVATLTKSSEDQKSSDFNKKKLSSYIEESSNSEQDKKKNEQDKKKNKQDNTFNEDFSSSPIENVTPRVVTDNASNNTKRRSIFSFNHNNTSRQSISSPVLLDDKDTRNSEIYSAFKVPGSLSNDKSFNSTLPKKNYIDINKENTTNNTKQSNKRSSMFSSPVPSTSSSSTIQAPEKKKSRNSLMSFFKYKKSVSTNNLGGSPITNNNRRTASSPMMRNSASHMDFRSTSNNQKKDSMSIRSAFTLGGNGNKSSRNSRMNPSHADNQSIGSNLTSRTSLSNFKNSIFGKLRSKNSSTTLNSSSSSILGMSFRGNTASRNRKVSSNANKGHSSLGASVAYGNSTDADQNDNFDTVSIKTSNTANFNLAIKNKISKNAKNSPQPQTAKTEFDNYDTIGTTTNVDKSSTSSPKNYKSPVNNEELPIIKQDTIPFNNDILQSFETLNLAPFSEGEILFPKSLDPEEVNNIVQIERSLSTRSTTRAESIKKKNSMSKRASIEVKAKEDGMTVVEGSTMDPLANNNVLSVGGVGIAGSARAPSLKKTSSILKKNKHVIKEEDVVHEDATNKKTAGEDEKNDRRVSQSMIDFGISFSDTNLDLDFPSFAQQPDKVGGNSVFDEMSSKSFESDDENEIFIQKPKDRHAANTNDNGHQLNKDYSFPATKSQQRGQQQQQEQPQKQNKNSGFRSYFNKGKLNYLSGNNKSDSQLNLPTTTSSSNKNNNKHLAVPSSDHDHRKTLSTSSTMSISSFASANSTPGNNNGAGTVQKKGVFLQLSPSSHSLVRNTNNRNGNNFGHSKVKFSSKIILYETYNPEDYDRHPEIATCNQLTPVLAQQIKEELNAFKAEMPIHEDSRCNTHFF